MPKINYVSSSIIIIVISTTTMTAIIMVTVWKFLKIERDSPWCFLFSTDTFQFHVCVLSLCLYTCRTFAYSILSSFFYVKLFFLKKILYK